jgi:hypothetical protein
MSFDLLLPMYGRGLQARVAASDTIINDDTTNK